MAYDWTMFFDEFGGELHQSFKKELSQQLLEKGDNTGIKQFQKHNFQLMVGMIPMDIRKEKDKVMATIEFITPTSWSIPTTISWTTNKMELELAHKSEVSSDSIDFKWEDESLKDKVEPHIAPYKKSKAEKNGFGFNAEYFYLLIPDVELEVFFKADLHQETINSINDFLQEFHQEWNKNKKGKEIEFISNLTKSEAHYSVVMDIGLKNTVRTINELLKSIGEKYSHLIEKVKIK
jgi:hypothetical protein